MPDKSRQTEAARRDCEAALRRHPHDADAHYRYAAALRDDDRLDAARKHFERAIRLNPRHAAAHHDLAILLRQLGDADTARKHYEAALKINPGSAQAQANLARLSLVRGAVSAGLDHALRAIRLRTLPDGGYRISGWFRRYRVDLERIVASVEESADRRGTALALLITHRPTDAGVLVDRCQQDAGFPSFGQVCTEILDLWTPQPEEA
ncbi:MAG: tetratricopeptide repeat protein [Phycisphaerae bacterium]